MRPVPQFLFDLGRFVPRRKSVPSFARFLAEVERTRRPRKRQRLAGAYFKRAQRLGLPLVEPRERREVACALFLYKGAAQRVALWCDLRGGQGNEFTRIAGTDLFYFQRDLEIDARMDYKFCASVARRAFA